MLSYAGLEAAQCQRLIEAHKECLRAEGFRVRSILYMLRARTALVLFSGVQRLCALLSFVLFYVFMSQFSPACCLLSRTWTTFPCLHASASAITLQQGLLLHF